MPVVLKDSDRQRLDGIVQQMISNKETDSDIQTVVQDFKQKYGEKKNPVGTQASSNTSIQPVTSTSNGTNQNTGINFGDFSKSNFGQQYKNTGDISSFVPKPVNIDTPKQRKAVEQGLPFPSSANDKNIAIENTAKKILAQKGLTDPNNTNYGTEFTYQKSLLKDKLNDKDVSLTYDKNGEPALKENKGILQSYVDAYNKGNEDAANADLFQKSDTQGKINLINSLQQQRDQNPFIESNNHPIASFLGGTQKSLEKFGAGTVATSALLAAAPETGGASLKGLPETVGVALSTNDSYNRGYMNEWQRSYDILKKEHPDLSDEEIGKIADKQGVIGGTVDAATNALLMGGSTASGGQLAKDAINGEARNIIGKALLGTAKMSGLPTIGTAATEEAGNINGVKTDQAQVFKDAVNSFKDNLTPALALHALGVATELPTAFRNALKYGVKDIPPEDISSTLKKSEESGIVPEGTADKVADELKNYNVALSKIPESIQGEKKAQVADLIDKKNKLIEDAKSKDSNFKENYDTQIAAIDDHIKNILQEPSEEEVADARAKELTAKMNQKPAPDYLISRHGDTIKDEEGKVSGTDMHPLSEDGKRDANMLADDVVKQSEQSGVPVTKVVSSDLERAKETAKTVADKTGAAIHHDEDLRTWDIGQFNETPDKEFKKIQQWFVEHPDEKIYKPDIETKEGEKPEDKDPNYGKKIGESFNDYAHRTIEAHKKYEGEPASTMLIDHSNNMMIMDAYRKNGNVWDENAAKEYLKSEKPEPATLQTKNTENGRISNSEGGNSQNQVGGGDNENIITEGDKTNQQSQQPTEEAQQPNTGVNQTQQAAGGEPPKEPVETDLPFGRDDNTGISHFRQQVRAYDVKTFAPERGKGVGVEEAIEHGRKLLADGRDPQKEADRFLGDQDKNVSYNGVALVRAEQERLEKATNAAIDKYGENSDEAKTALNAERDWYNKVVKPMQTEWSKIGQAQQGQVNIDTGSYTGLVRSVERQTGKELTKSQKNKAADLSEDVKIATDKVNKKTDEISKAHEENVANEEKAKEKKPKKDYAKERKDAFQAARDALKKIRGESQSTLVPYARELAAIAPHVAKIVKSLIEEGVDKLSDIVERIHDEFKDDIKGLRKRDVMDVIAGDYNKKTDVTKNPDEQKLADIRRQAKLTKKLQDLQNDLPEDYDKNKQEQSPEVKKLLDQIKKVKQDLDNYKGVPEQKRIDALQKKLDDLRNGVTKNKAEEIEKSEKEKDLLRQISDEKEKIKYNDLLNRIGGKTDSKFEPKDAKDIWDYVRNNYIDKGQQFGDAVQKASMDLGLSPQQVIDAIATPKDGKKLTLEAYRLQRDRNKAVQSAELWAKNQNKNPNPASALITAMGDFFRGAKTIGHAHALLGTHAPLNLFDYKTAIPFLKLYGRMWKIVYGNPAEFEKAQSWLTNHPLYNQALKDKLAVDPHSIYDDWQLANTFLKKLKIQGNKGFLILKMLRMMNYEAEWNSLSDVEKADEQTGQLIAKNINHWTGTAGLPVSPLANVAVFAPNLVASKFARITTDPIQALYTLSKQGLNKTGATDFDVSPAKKAEARIILRKTASVAAGYVGALALNQAMLSITGSNQKINFTNPSKSDWLRFKGFGSTLDPSGGMVNTTKFTEKSVTLPFRSEESIKQDYRGATAKKEVNDNITNYIRSTASPFAGLGWDFSTHKDFEGNTLPPYNDKPDKGKTKLGWGYYGLQTFSPIPAGEAERVIHDELYQKGMRGDMLKTTTKAVIYGILGSAGLKVGDEPKEKK